MSESVQPRLVKGINLSQLVPLLRKRRRQQSLGMMSAAAERLMEERILDHLWYPHAPFVDLLRVLYREVLANNENNALSMGIAGGRVTLQGVHKAFVVPGDPVASAMAMRHSWQSYFNFGEQKAVQEGDRSVVLTINGYSDVTPIHAGLIAGWTVAAAQLGGAPQATCDIFEKPWLAGTKLSFRVTT